MEFGKFLKRAHLYLFLFISSELVFSGAITNDIQSAIRRVVVILGTAYGVLFFARFPRHLRITTLLYLILIVILVSISYLKYSVALGSLQYMSLSLTFTVVYGGFIAAWYMKEVSIKEFVVVIWLLYVFQQVILGKILLHQFNATDRSTTVDETYFLNLVLCYYLVNFLKSNKGLYMNLFIATFFLIIIFFHRTVWITSVFSICVVAIIMREDVKSKMSRITLLTLPYAIIAIVVVSLFIAIKPSVVENVVESLSDIKNSDTQGTAGWRHDQRELYMKRIVERPFFGWMYDGYDDGELTAVLENNESWIGVKGTFIHSGYIHILYHYGIFGMILIYGLLLNTLLFMWRRFRSETGYISLFAFLCTGVVFSWSYQLPIFYWVLVGVGSYMACLVPVDHFNGQKRQVLRDESKPILVN